MELWNLLQVVGSGKYLFRVGNLSDDPQDRSDPWGVPPQCGLLPCRDEVVEGHHVAVGIPTFGGVNVSNRARGGGGIYPPTS